MKTERFPGSTEVFLIFTKTVVASVFLFELAELVDQVFKSNQLTLKLAAQIIVGMPAMILSFVVLALAIKDVYDISRNIINYKQEPESAFWRWKILNLKF